MAKNGKMLILRGNSDPDGKQKYPEEYGKPASWPIEWPKYQAIARKHHVHQQQWNPVNWKNGLDTIYHTNPHRNLLPATLPQEIRDNVSTHMFGPDVLVAGNWPDETSAKACSFSRVCLSPNRQADPPGRLAL